jgi:ribosomal protein S18 acetylase RimI-like enzyme
MHIDEANLHNLTQLWHKYGSKPVNVARLPLLQINTHWPHRCWINWRAQQDEGLDQLQGLITDSLWEENLPKSTFFSLWPKMSVSNLMHASKYGQRNIEKMLLDKHWYCAFEQTAMYLALHDKTKYLSQARPGFKVKPAATLNDIKQWIDIGSKAFGYSIDPSVIKPLVNDIDIQLLIGWENDQAIACGLLYKTDDIIGVHQIGVKPAFQGKGFAKSFMLDLIAACEQWQGKHIVLQASQTGKPLYDSLGFKSQFLIKNFKRV